MAKAIKLYTGRDSRNTPVEVAQRNDGVWFYRQRQFNGFGVTWTKWTMHSNVKFPTKGTNHYTGEDYFIPPEEQENKIEWGWSTLAKSNEFVRRLPNV